MLPEVEFASGFEPSLEDLPRAVSGQHLPALDGLRGVAILSVLAFHLGFGWASGGFLGVDLFFVLSGFLITSLLLEEWLGTRQIRLSTFWIRRARRLLPALFLVVIAVVVYTVVNGRSSPTVEGASSALGILRGDAVATILYFANWHTIFVSQALSPLSHTWSLAIEEQFYLVWPVLILALLKFSPKNWRRIGVTPCVIGALASAIEMAALIHPNNSGFDRIYYGTDTRAFALLAGAAVAMLVAGRPQPGPRVRSVLHMAAPIAAAFMVVFWAMAAQYSNWLFRGGFLAYAALAAVVVADVRQFERGLLGRLLSFRPLRWIGTISYGLYLWHWPVIFYLNEQRTGLSGFGLDLARLSVTLLVATTSFYLIERPIRRRSFSGLRAGLLVPSAAVVSVLVVLAGTSPSVAAPVRAWPGGGLNPGSGPNVPGAGDLSGQVRIALPPDLTFSPAHPLSVLTIGDTVMTTAELGIAKALESTGEVNVVRYALPTWGLTEPSALSFLKRDLRLFHPQVIIGTWAADNAMAVANPAAYRRSLDAAIETLLSPGDGVVGVIFLQMPAFGPIPKVIASSPGDPNWRQRAAGRSSWNEAVREAAADYPGKVMYFPIGTSVELEGRYTSWLPPSHIPSSSPRNWVRVRASDGIDLCPPGVTRYAAPVLQDLTSLFALPPAQTHWWDGYAITVQAFNNQDSNVALTCPDDHPK